MKKLISLLSLTLFIGVVTASTQCCDGAISENSTNNKLTCDENQTTGQVKVYYFHATRRCATCEAVEAVTKEALKEYYGDKIPFESINREKEKDNPLVKKYKINGQTLLVVKGDKMVDLTSAAFMNARTNPDKLKSRIKATIDSML
ncbi:MAG: nitrophenyl compound nitroreductase subunit ArsF family protein [Draconibacterium sp.]|nr:nitrophenyl compound nitroreductase subunit ArsF family protein [Draconibacterium sp.]